MDRHRGLLSQAHQHALSLVSFCLHAHGAWCLLHVFRAGSRSREPGRASRAPPPISQLTKTRQLTWLQPSTTKPPCTGRTLSGRHPSTAPQLAAAAALRAQQWCANPLAVSAVPPGKLSAMEASSPGNCRRWVGERYRRARVQKVRRLRRRRRRHWRR